MISTTIIWDVNGVVQEVEVENEVNRGAHTAASVQSVVAVRVGPLPRNVTEHEVGVVTETEAEREPDIAAEARVEVAAEAKSGSVGRRRIEDESERDRVKEEEKGRRVLREKAERSESREKGMLYTNIFLFTFDYVREVGLIEIIVEHAQLKVLLLFRKFIWAMQ